MQGAYLPVEISIRIEIRIEIQPLALAWKDSEHPMQRSCCPMAAAPAARRGQMGSSCLSLPGCRAGSACSPSAEGETPLCRQTVALPAPGQIVMLTGNPCRRRDASPGEGASSKTEFWSNLLHQTIDFGFSR